MKKLRREELRKILLEEIEKAILNEADDVIEVKVAKRGTTFKHPGGEKEYKLKIPIGFKKIMFGSSMPVTVNGVAAEKTQGQYRVTVKNVGRTYYISAKAGSIKVKPVR